VEQGGVCPGLAAVTTLRTSYNLVVGRTKDKESGVFETVIDWLINDDHDNESDSKEIVSKDDGKEYDDDDRKR
jgi:hypothetical protein